MLDRGIRDLDQPSATGPQTYRASYKLGADRKISFQDKLFPSSYNKILFSLQWICGVGNTEDIPKTVKNELITRSCGVLNNSKEWVVLVVYLTLIIKVKRIRIKRQAYITDTKTGDQIYEKPERRVYS